MLCKVMKAGVPHLQLPICFCREKANTAHPLYKAQVRAILCKRCPISLQQGTSSLCTCLQHMQLAPCSFSQALDMPKPLGAAAENR